MKYKVSVIKKIAFLDVQGYSEFCCHARDERSDHPGCW